MLLFVTAESSCKYLLASLSDPWWTLEAWYLYLQEGLNQDMEKVVLYSF
jgi:hypothetical protein